MEGYSENHKIVTVLEVLSRRRWFVILPFCIVMMAGLSLAFKLPKIYEAKTMILIQPPKVPEAYVRPVISSEIEQRITTISQQIMSRTNLEKIIRQFDLFMDQQYEKWFIEDKIENLRKRISVEVITVGRRDADAFSISYRGKEPGKIMNITNTLATYFINENLKQREAQAVGTSEFLKDELEAMRKLLEEHEAKIKDFRKQNMGGLPEQLQTNLRILDQLQMQLNEKQENLRNAKNRLISIDNKLSEKPTLPQQIYIYPTTNETDNETDPEIKLEKLKQQLEKKRSIYSEKYPDVIRLKREIKSLEEKIERAALSESNSEEASQASIGKIHPYVAEQRRLLAQQRAEIELEITKLKSENTNLVKKIAYYQKLVEDTPKKEQVLQSINRDYDNIKDTYHSLLERQMQASLAVNMEKKQKGEQFRIIDKAQIPTKPIKPKMNRLFLLTLMAGLGLGFGLVFLLERLDTSTNRIEEIEAESGLPVIAFIPRIVGKKDKRLQRINLSLTIASVTIAFLQVAAFGLLVMKGTQFFIDTLR